MSLHDEASTGLVKAPDVFPSLTDLLANAPANVRSTVYGVAGCDLMRTEEGGPVSGSLGNVTQATLDALTPGELALLEVGVAARSHLRWDGAQWAYLRGVYPEDWFGGDVGSGWLIAMLSAGVRNIRLSNRSYPFPGTASSRVLSGYDDVVICGDALPRINSGRTALEGGAIILGGLALGGCHRWTISDVGFDGGSAYRATAPANEWAADGGLIASNGSRMDWRRCVSLSQSMGDGMHGFLVQGADDSVLDELETCYGSHGVAIKARRVKLGIVYSYMTSSAVTIKTDSVADASGYVSDGVTVGTIASDDCATTLQLVSGGTVAEGADLRNITIQSVVSRWSAWSSGQSRHVVLVAGRNGNTDAFRNIRIGLLQGRNTNFGIYSSNLDIQSCSIGRIQMERAGGAVVLANSTSAPFVIGEIAGANIATTLNISKSTNLIVGSIGGYFSTGTQVAFADSARLVIGQKKFDQASAALIPPTAHTYSNSCADYSGNSNPFRLDLGGGRKLMSGDVAPGTASATLNYVVMTLPSYCCPTKTQTIPVLSLQSGGHQMLAATVSTSGVITILSLPENTTYMAFDAAFD